ncbi:MAG: hypothetical protein ACE5IW_09760 [bacterium]
MCARSNGGDSTEVPLGFGGDVVMDALRTHPLCIMGQFLVPNPFHVFYFRN